MLVILKAVSATALLNAWFLVPFLDYMVSGTYVINDADKYGSYRIEQTGIFVAQLFMGNFEPFGHSLYRVLRHCVKQPEPVQDKRHKGHRRILAHRRPKF